MRRQLLGSFACAVLLAVAPRPSDSVYYQLPPGDTTNPGGGSCTSQSGCMECVVDTHGRFYCAQIFGGGAGCSCQISTRYDAGSKTTVSSCATVGSCTYTH